MKAMPDCVSSHESYSKIDSLVAGRATDFDDLCTHLLDHQFGVPSDLDVPHASIICSLHCSQVQVCTTVQHTGIICSLHYSQLQARNPLVQRHSFQPALCQQWSNLMKI